MHFTRLLILLFAALLVPQACAAKPQPQDDPHLSAVQWRSIGPYRGGRSVAVTVDGTGTGTVDDFGINMAIFEGRINGSYIL